MERGHLKKKIEKVRNNIIYSYVEGEDGNDGVKTEERRGGSRKRRRLDEKR